MGQEDVVEETRALAYKKRLRGFSPVNGEAIFEWVQDGETVELTAPRAPEQVAEFAHVPRSIVRVIAEVTELKASTQSYSYNMEDDAWDGSGVWYNRAAVLPQRGTGPEQRLGQSLVLRRLVCQGMVSDGDAELTQRFYRLVVVRDSQRATVGMDANTMVFDGTEITSNFRPDTVGPGKRFQVVADQTLNPQKMVTGTLRVPFKFVIDTEDELCVNADDGMGFTPQYYLLSTYNDDTVHLVVPVLAYTWTSYFVDP